MFSNGNSESWARTKVDIAEAFDYIDSPGKGETWSGGGIDFYSKNGEGSGVKAKDRSRLDYVNGDDMMAFLKLGNSFSKGLKGLKETPHPDILPVEKSKLAKYLDKANKGLSKFNKYKKHLEQVIQPVFKKLDVPVVCESCGAWRTKLTKQPIDEKDITPEQRRDAEKISINEFHE
ncbi:hypothetical protein NHF50_00155 [Flavobacterium sp. NRK F10]|uniref:hypothetical protein n=1 Tax=Flavobacterium sp. NRK F10 TaxID=2954931 RepID=UPI002090DC29|nr:hypothetical protein [Flavobacterium sp. NRK F10]MCO6173447.1 hypothetical protein [Flavobacterium sp. NRK F10]